MLDNPIVVDASAIAAGWDIVKRLGPDAARQLLQILELPDEARWAVGTSMFLKQGRCDLPCWAPSPTIVCLGPARVRRRWQRRRRGQGPA